MTRAERLAATDRKPAPSWWCGLDREALQSAIADHVPQFHQQKKGFMDFVGAILMRDSWEPGRDPSRIGRDA